jgi:hypothetical protein
MMVSKPSICFVIPYFGEWPFWMPFFWASCQANPDVDWLFFTDCEKPGDAPENVRIEPISFEKYCALVSERLNINFYPPDAYKLCDIKPALGYIHSDLLEHYDFWGFGDIDLVYGDLRRYFNTSRLSRYDLLSTHERRVSGHLCLIRNTARMRNAFKLMKNWQERLSDPVHHALDEGAFTRIFLKRKNFPKLLQNAVGLFNPWRRCSEFKEAYSTPGGRVAWHDGSYRFPKEWFWLKGKLYNNLDGQNKEFPYFHFVVWKRNEWKDIDPQTREEMKLKANVSNWRISAEGFNEFASSASTH